MLHREDPAQRDCGRSGVTQTELKGKAVEMQWKVVTGEKVEAKEEMGRKW